MGADGSVTGLTARDRVSALCPEELDSCDHMGSTGRPQGRMIPLVDDRREHYVEVDLG